ncbi:hypothetical protein [Streptomyces acidiscabies]|uniref:hypothetical protein n=1 Tax=Streptomyces acidiscabies TaxID=42234 RepID=UPI0021170A16|nr:hypothetical protein [Streptomyces acidiscabies]
MAESLRALGDASTVVARTPIEPCPYGKIAVEHDSLTPPMGAEQKREEPMQALRKVSMAVGIAAVVTLSLAPQAQASQNSGWVYTSNASGAAFFDADLNGDPGVEKITACDNKTDGRGTQVVVTGRNGSGSVAEILSDPSNDGHCASMTGDFFREETSVGIAVYEYWTENGEIRDAHVGRGSGIA